MGWFWNNWKKKKEPFVNITIAKFEGKQYLFINGYEIYLEDGSLIETWVASENLLKIYEYFKNRDEKRIN